MINANAIAGPYQAGLGNPVVRMSGMHLRILAACQVLVLGWAVPVSQSGGSRAAEAIYFNARVATVDGKDSIAEAFAVRDGRFIAVGTNASIRALADAGTQQIDLRGHTVVPGMIDNHNHQYHVALLTMRGVDLQDTATLQDLLARVRAAAISGKPGATVFTTTGWDPGRFPEKRGPTRQELDAIATDRPIVVYQSRGRVYVNSAALTALGTGRETTTIARVTVAKDAAGEPDGVLSGSPAAVLNLTARIVPPPSLDEMQTILTGMQAKQHAMGLTGIRDLQLSRDVMRAYFELWRRGKLTLRTSVGLEVNAGDEAELESMLSGWGVGAGFGDEWLRIDCIAEYNPGEQLREPYIDRPGADVGELRLPVERFRQSILTINRAGWRPAIHITGDRTLDVVLDAYEAADRERSIRDRRWVVEHVPLVHPDQMERMKRLGVVVSAQFQPYGSGAEMIARLGRPRAERAVPIRELLDRGLVVSGGSDWPGAPNKPFVNIYYYVTRKTREAGILGAAQKISRLEALRLMTINNAFLTFEERLKGSIEAGKLADFVVLSEDLLTVPEEKILDITALATYVGGKKMYSNTGF
jgi:predicted amidohydrolase YtcJ